MLAVLKRVARQIPAVLGLALLCGAVYVIWKEFRDLKIADIRAALAAIPPRALLLAFLWTVLSYGVLTFYDRLGTIYAGHKVSYGRVSFASFCAYALSHNLGFAAVSGAAVRYRLYSHWGLSPFEIAKVVAFCSLTFGLGGMVLGGIILFVEPDAVPILRRHRAALGHVRGGAAAVGGGGCLCQPVPLRRHDQAVRPLRHPAELPDGRRPGRAGHGGRGRDGGDLLPAPAGRAGPDLPAVPGRVRRLLHGGACGQRARRNSACSTAPSSRG